MCENINSIETPKKPKKKSWTIFIFVAIFLLLIPLLYNTFGFGVRTRNIKTKTVQGSIKVRQVEYLIVTSYKFYYVSPIGWHYLIYEDGDILEKHCDFINKYDDGEAAAYLIDDKAYIWWEVNGGTGIFEKEFDIAQYGLCPWWFYMVAVIVLLWGSIAIIVIIKKKQKTAIL